MKEIKAYMRPHKLSDVTLALYKVEGLTGVSVMDVRGCGRMIEKDDHLNVEEAVMDYEPHVKIEIVCSDELVDEIVAAIQTSAHTGLRGDGKIYISTIDEAIRISTGERGEEAV